VTGHRQATLAAAGLVLGVVAVVAGGQSPTGTTTPPTTWFGLLSPTGYRAGDPWGWGAASLLASALLVPLWVVAVGSRLPERAVWRLAAVWGLPFVIGPPLISKDVYAYAANGLMLRAGVDVYTHGADGLQQLHTADATRALAAVDPTWHQTPSPYGPLASLLVRTAAQVSGGNPVGTVVVLRAVAVVSVVALAAAAAALAGRHRATAVALIALNPLVLLHAVSGAHVEAPMCALLLLGLLAATRNRWALAVVLVCAAGAIKAPAYAALGAMVVLHARQRDPVRAVGQDVAVALAASAAFTVLVPHGLGWLANLTTPTKGKAPVSLANAVAALLPGVGAHPVQLGFLAAGAVIVVGLALTAERRPLETSVGIGLLALMALAPVFYPWYVLWGAACLLPTARGRGREGLIVLCGLAALFATTGTPSRFALILHGVEAAVAAGWLVQRYRAQPVEEEPLTRPRPATGTRS
jgi:hypothetical protein